MRSFTRGELGSRLLTFVAVVVGACLLAACGALWTVKQKAPHHHLPKKITLYVAMSPAVSESDSGLSATVDPGGTFVRIQLVASLRASTSRE
jgi:hypothetical protein